MNKCRRSPETYIGSHTRFISEPDRLQREFSKCGVAKPGPRRDFEGRKARFFFQWIWPCESICMFSTLVRLRVVRPSSMASHPELSGPERARHHPVAQFPPSARLAATHTLAPTRQTSLPLRSSDGAIVSPPPFAHRSSKDAAEQIKDASSTYLDSLGNMRAEHIERMLRQRVMGGAKRYPAHTRISQLPAAGQLEWLLNTCSNLALAAMLFRFRHVGREISIVCGRFWQDGPGIGPDLLFL